MLGVIYLGLLKTRCSLARSVVMCYWFLLVFYLNHWSFCRCWCCCCGEKWYKIPDIWLSIVVFDSLCHVKSIFDFSSSMMIRRLNNVQMEMVRMLWKHIQNNDSSSSNNSNHFPMESRIFRKFYWFSSFWCGCRCCYLLSVCVCKSVCVCVCKCGVYFAYFSND